MSTSWGNVSFGNGIGSNLFGFDRTQNLEDRWSSEMNAAGLLEKMRQQDEMDRIADMYEKLQSTQALQEMYRKAIGGRSLAHQYLDLNFSGYGGPAEPWLSELTKGFAGTGGSVQDLIKEYNEGFSRHGSFVATTLANLVKDAAASTVFEKYAKDAAASLCGNDEAIKALQVLGTLPFSDAARWNSALLGVSTADEFVHVEGAPNETGLLDSVHVNKQIDPDRPTDEQISTHLAALMEWLGKWPPLRRASVPQIILVFEVLKAIVGLPSVMTINVNIEVGQTSNATVINNNYYGTSEPANVVPGGGGQHPRLNGTSVLPTATFLDAMLIGALDRISIRYVVRQRPVQIRCHPASGSNVVAVLTAGTEVSAIGKIGKWVCLYDDTLETSRGWAMKKYLTRI